MPGARRPSAGLLLVSTTLLLSIVAVCDAACGNKATIQLVGGNCTVDTVGTASEIATCMSTLKVDTVGGFLTFKPVSTRIYKYWDYPGREVTRDCQTATAKGKAAGAKSATVQLYRDEYKESKLTATGSSTLELRSFRYYSGRSTIEVCQFNYKVVEGCLLGATASGAFTCPSATGAKTGLKGAKYCEPCAFNSYSPGASTSCKPCPTEAKLGALPASVRAQCPSCLATGSCSNNCTDGSSVPDPSSPASKCIKCPRGSFPTPKQDACAICQEGRRCCLVNPTPDCPACPKGAAGKPLSFSLAAVGVAGAAKEKCPFSAIYQCQAYVRVTINGDCTIRVTAPPAYRRPSYIRDLSAAPAPAPPAHPTNPDPFPCPTVLPEGLLPVDLSVNNSGTFNFADILPRVLSGWSQVLPVKPVGISGAYFTTTYSNTTCQVRYRVHSATNPAALAPLKLPGSCSPDAPECAKTCPAGSYITGGLCLPCPGGSYSTKPNSKACTACKAGTAAFGSGNTRCRTCPPGTAAGAGGSFCESCTANFVNRYSSKGQRECLECPLNTTSIGTGCISTNAVAPCCLTGNCTPYPACPSSTPPPRAEANALLRPLTQSPTCAATPFISCAEGGSIYVTNAFDEYQPSNMLLAVLGGSKAGPYCSRLYDARQAPAVRTGLATFSMPIVIGTQPTNFESWRGAAVVSPTGLVTITVAKVVSSDEALASVLPAPCVATYQLVSGTLLIAQKSAATCPKGLRPVTTGSISMCRTCSIGNAFIGGKCVKCSGITYAPDFDATTCSPCPPGNYPGYPNDEQGGFTCLPCELGTRRTAAGDCQPCPVNTYSLAASDACTKCPAGTSTKGRKGLGFCYI